MSHAGLVIGTWGLLVNRILMELTSLEQERKTTIKMMKRQITYHVRTSLRCSQDKVQSQPSAWEPSSQVWGSRSIIGASLVMLVPGDCHLPPWAMLLHKPGFWLSSSLYPSRLSLPSLGGKFAFIPHLPPHPDPKVTKFAAQPVPATKSLASLTVPWFAVVSSPITHLPPTVFSQH